MLSRTWKGGRREGERAGGRSEQATLKCENGGREGRREGEREG